MATMNPPQLQQEQQQEQSDLSEIVSKCALDHYHTTLNKGKPKDETEWTVYAAIIASLRRQEVDDNKNNNNNNNNNHHDNPGEESSDTTTNQAGTVSTWVVSCATGTKCTTLRKEGMIVHDCHAEVLARRGLIRVLQLEMIHNNVEQNQRQQEQEQKEQEQEQKEQQSSLTTRDRRTSPSPSFHLLEPVIAQGQTKFQLRKNLQLHFYISDSPCGDASIYAINRHATVYPNGDDDDKGNHTINNKIESRQELLYTGAKVIVSEQTGVDAATCGGNHQLLESGGGGGGGGEASGRNIAREDLQVLGKLRTKSGRSNLPCHLRSTSMSCSDKLVQWSILGLQGALLSNLVVTPIRLHSIVVSRDPRGMEDGGLERLSSNHQLEALQRAIPRRVQETWEYVQKSNRMTENSMTTTTTTTTIISHPPIDQNVPIPIVSLTVQVFPSGKSAVAARVAQQSRPDNSNQIMPIPKPPNKRQRMETNMASGTISPCGFALNWQQSDPTIIELLIGARGICQGKKPKSIQDYERLASRLCRRSQIGRCQQYQSLLVQNNNDMGDNVNVNVENQSNHYCSTYQEWKSQWCCETYKNLKSFILQDGGGPLVGWLRNQDDFVYSLIDRKG